MTWTPYDGDRYLDYPEIEAWCRDLARAHPDRVSLETIGESRQGRPILLLTIGAAEGPAMWLDGGTHASEWAGVMATLFTVSRWITRLVEGDPAAQACFANRRAHVLPCISPDGYEALRSGAPMLRSTLRPPRDGRPRVGLEPGDIDGDGEVRWMRWRHPAGPWLFDADNPIRMRHRTLDDDPTDAFFVTTEGRFLAFDGVRWTRARLQHGLDLNRNFPSSWAPFEMFGMDSGAYPLSEPESRAVMEAVRARPAIAAAISNHTYTGALLTQPYRARTPLGAADLDLMEALGHQSVAGTGYRVLRVHPDFVYDEAQEIVGVWADTLSTTFGIPGYTLELWDPYGQAGEKVEFPAKFFRRPDVELIGRVVDHFSDAFGDVTPWRPFDHPDLGQVEIGGLPYMTTIRNPPEPLLAQECERAATVADRMLRALPELRCEVRTDRIGEVTRVTLVVENLGFLPTSGLRHAEHIGAAPPITARLSELVGVEPIDAPTVRELGWLDGWGGLQVQGAHHPLYPDLPDERGVRTSTTWLLRGAGALTVAWEAGRAGRGSIRVEVVG